MDTELLCKTCAAERQNGSLIGTEAICQECFEYVTREIGDLEGVQGKPEIRVRSEPFDVQLLKTDLPREIGKVIDISAVAAESRSVWLLLAEDGVICRFDADSGHWSNLARASVDPERDHQPWCNRVLRQRLHSSPNGDFAAVVNDYGRNGQIIDLRNGKVRLALDGGDYHPETVPFSFAFAIVKGRLVAIHRTSWNRLDLSDPYTGAFLSVRNPTSYKQGEDRPVHYLDYFHGALHVSPNGVRILDDGWVWHPVGIPRAWSLENWLSDNVWESEDGPTRKVICSRLYYWDHAMTWLNDQRVAIGGLSEDDAYMVDGARIFDVSVLGEPSPSNRTDWAWPREVATFAGPAGAFFCDYGWLFSSDQTGLSRWDVNDGSQTAHLDEIAPTHHHRIARELVQIAEGSLIRAKIS